MSPHPITPALSQDVELRLLEARFGAEVTGVHLDPDLSRSQLEALKDALLRHKVLVFRQQHLSPEAHARFAARFGIAVPALAGPEPEPGGPRSATWVAERSFDLRPPKIVTFRAASPEATGNRILVADAVAAYRHLPRPLRALADRSWAVHAEQAARRWGGERARSEPAQAPGTTVAHPVVRLHTETGDRALLLGRHARRIIGLSGGESRTVLALLQSYLVRPGNLLQWTWSEGDVMLIDARATLRQDRRLGSGQTVPLRIDVAGDIPLGLDGQHSHPLSIEPPERRSA